MNKTNNKLAIILISSIILMSVSDIASAYVVYRGGHGYHRGYYHRGYGYRHGAYYWNNRHYNYFYNGRYYNNCKFVSGNRICW